MIQDHIPLTYERAKEIVPDLVADFALGARRSPEELETRSWHIHWSVGDDCLPKAKYVLVGPYIRKTAEAIEAEMEQWFKEYHTLIYSYLNCGPRARRLYRPDPENYPPELVTSIKDKLRGWLVAQEQESAHWAEQAIEVKIAELNDMLEEYYRVEIVWPRDAT